MTKDGSNGRDDDRVVIEATKQGLRRITSTVERLAPPKRPSWSETGELRLDELDDSGVFEVDARSAEYEIAPLVRAKPLRPRTEGERRLRLFAASSLLLLGLVFFGQALGGALKRATSGKVADRWRTLPLTVSSSPSRATVSVEDKARGVTPYSALERCRGRTIHVRVERPGYAIWQWSGLCPVTGPLQLDAALQRLP